MSLQHHLRSLAGVIRIAPGFLAVLLGATPVPTRADPTTDTQGAAPTSLPSIGRFEIVQGIGRNPPLMLDTSSGTTWSLVPDGEPNGYGWARIEIMDASEAAEAREARGRAGEMARLDHRARD